MKKTKKRIALLLVSALTIGLLAGCSQDKDCTAGRQDSIVEATTGNVTIAGSTSVQTLSEELAAAFMNKASNVDVQIQGGGSGVGIKAVNDGIAQIGALSRTLKEEEKIGLTEYIIAKDGIAVIVNSDTYVDNLSIEQIRKIFTGEITNWKVVGGDDQEIIVVSREEGSGTRGAFVELTGIETSDSKGKKTDNTAVNALVQGSTGAIKQTVSSTPNTIGYVSVGSLDERVKAVLVENVEATEVNIKNQSYKISRPFIYVVKGEINDATKAYIDFVLSDEGQAIVAEEFVPIN